jgi:dTDP-glucose 4,6-dehydratase
VQVSTDEVYGSMPLRSKKLFTETTSFAPNIPYSATKAGGDMLCRAYFQTFKVPVIVTHASNNYGSYQYPEKLIPFFVTQAIEGKPLPLYGNGKNVRDWLHVLDHCEALRLVLLKGKPGEVYNIGADNERSNVEIAQRILARFKDSGSKIVFVADRPGHDLRYAIDASKIRRELGWRPKYSFLPALDETITWYMENPKWIKRVRERTGVFNPHIDLWKGHKIK